MPDISQQILDLNDRVSNAKERSIRLQTKRETLQKNLDALVDEIKGAGYNPTTLKEDRDRLEKELLDKKTALEEKLNQAEELLDSIPE